jgi:hypothetical protein
MTTSTGAVVPAYTTSFAVIRETRTSFCCAVSPTPTVKTGIPNPGGPVDRVFSFGVHPVREHDDRPDVEPLTLMREREQSAGDIRGFIPEGVRRLSQRAPERRTEGIQLCLNAGRDGVRDDGREKFLDLFGPVACPVDNGHARAPVGEYCHDRRVMDDERGTENRLQQKDEEECKRGAPKDAQEDPP